MPRISIDDSLYRDIRFRKLCLRVGCDYKSVGMVVAAFTLAQEHFLTESNDRLIPFHEYPEDLQILCEMGIVVKKEKGYYVRGSEDHFSWLIQRQNAGKAKKSKRKVVVSSEDNETKRDETESNGTKARSITRSRSITNTRSVFKYDPTKLEDRGNTSIHGSRKQTLAAKQQTPKKNFLSTEEKDLNREIWEAYRNQYLNLYGVEPIRNAKINTHVDQLRKRLGAEAPKVVEFYFRHPNGFYIKNSHDISYCLKDAESLRTQMLRNKPITHGEVKRFEDKYEFINQQKRFEEMLKDNPTGENKP